MFLEFCGLMIFSQRSSSMWTGSQTLRTGSTSHCTELTLPGTPVCLPACLPACLSFTGSFMFSSMYLCRYRRKGSSALGLDSRTQIVRWEDSAPDKKHKEKRDERYFSPSNRRLLSCEAPPILSAPPTDSTLSTEPASFIPLPPCKEESDPTPQTGTSTDPLRVYDPATSLWLEGKGQPEVKGQVQVPVSNLLTMRVEEFNRNLRENPTDVNTWLEFIQFQVYSFIIYLFTPSNVICNILFR